MPTAPVPMAEQVLEWIQRHIERQRLGPGDALPKELEIARDTGASRSSVREALTALKVLGIIRSRRRGGITIMRGPALLGLRDYLVERYTDRRRFREALEFRSVLEQGFAPQVAEHISEREIAALRRIVEDVRDSDTVDLIGPELRFHAILARAAGNRLAQLLAEVYVPVFRSYAEFEGPAVDQRDDWVAHHLQLVEPLERGDGAVFIKRMREHVAAYLPG